MARLQLYTSSNVFGCRSSANGKTVKSCPTLLGTFAGRGSGFGWELLIQEPGGATACLAGGFRFLPRMTWLRMCFLVLGSCKDEVETKTNGFVVIVRVGQLDALVLLGDMALACL